MNYFKTRYSEDYRRDYVWKKIIKDLAKHICFYDNVLDLGAGYGSFINNISCKNKWAIDKNPKTKDFLNNDVNFVLKSILEDTKGLPESYFDCVFMSNFLEHFSDEELDIIINKVKKVLKPFGKIVVIQPNYKYSYKEYYDDYTHKKAFTHVSMLDFLKSKGFHIIMNKPKYLPYSFKSKASFFYKLIGLYLNMPFKVFAKQMLFIAEKK
jgi:ubiquinone/menaquinone biosynthesis C-methylase UbiE